MNVSHCLLGGRVEKTGKCEGLSWGRWESLEQTCGTWCGKLTTNLDFSISKTPIFAQKTRNFVVSLIFGCFISLTTMSTEEVPVEAPVEPPIEEPAQSVLAVEEEGEYDSSFRLKTASTDSAPKTSGK